MDDLVYSASRYSFFFSSFGLEFFYIESVHELRYISRYFFSSRYIDPFNSNILFHRINAILDL